MELYEANHNAKQALTTRAFRWAALSDVGRIRTVNEDAHHVEPEIGLFLISDGMGGHRGGHMASRIVTEDLPVMIENKLHALRSSSPRAVLRVIRSTLAEQNKQLWMEAVVGEYGYREMGATVVLLLIRAGRAYAANLGDSRIYRLRNGRLRQLTRDHSVIFELIAAGKIKPHEADGHEAQGQITKYVGMDAADTSPHVKTFALAKGDRFLLCTDGLTDMLDEGELRRILVTAEDPEKACRALTDAANAAGGLDNITAVVVDCTHA